MSVKYSRKIKKELPYNDLRRILEQKKSKSNENSLKSDDEISCQTRVRNLSLKETIQISLGIIKKPRKVVPIEKYNSTTSQKVDNRKKNISNITEEEKLCHKEFFILPKKIENSTKPTKTTTTKIAKCSSSKLQKRLVDLKTEKSFALQVLSQVSNDAQQEYTFHHLNPEVEEFIPSSSISSSMSSSSLSHIQQHNENLSNEDVIRISLAKLTQDQQLGLLTVSKLKPKYFQDNFEYFIEYYNIIGEFLNINAVCDFLNASGISFFLPTQSSYCNYY